MYSFEGKFRTTPTVSLGGKRKQDKVDKERLLLNAQRERQKRENIRQRLRSALVIQSSVRSFLVRQHLKKQFRIEFDKNRSQVTSGGPDFENLILLSRQLKFFYNSKQDGERLSWVGQQVLRKKTDWISKDSLELFSTSGILKLSSRFLRVADSASSVAIPLRVIETFTDDKFIKNNRRLNDDDTELCMLKLWKNLVENGYFRSILNLLSTRVPSDIEPVYQGGNVRAPTPLAETLLSLLVRPLLLAGEVKDDSSNVEEEKMEVCDRISEAINLRNKILNSFICEVLVTGPTIQLYHYIFPAMGQMSGFPVEILLESSLRFIEEGGQSPPGLLGALAKFVHPNLDSVSERCFISYLSCVRCLLLRLPPVRHSHEDQDSDESDSDEEERMEYKSYHTQGNVIPLADLVSDCHSVLSSQSFINACVSRKIHEAQTDTVLDSICAICYHLIAIKRVNIQKNTLLHTLAFSSSFLRKLWNSMITSSTASKITGKSIPLVQLLVEGSPMSPEETDMIQSKLVVFCALFNLYLLAVPDTDFYSVTGGSMPFTTTTLVSIAMLMRDVCLSTIKRALPETRTRLGRYDVKSVLQALATGCSVAFENATKNKESEIEMRRYNNFIYLFNICRRLVKHLHTRDSRRSFIPKGSWLSNSIKTEQSSDLAQRWHRRHRRAESNSAVAAHLANSSDEDIVLSVNEARQLAVLVNMPFVVPFDTRASIFMTMLQSDREGRENERERFMLDAGIGPSAMTNEVTVRRDFIYEDAFNDLSLDNAPNMRRRLRVRFVNAMGLDEAGYGSGVTREFLQQLVKAGFDPKRGFFKTTADGRLYPNPHASDFTENANDHFYFLGRMLGKVIYEGMQVELPFASFFLCKILQRKSRDLDINHLQSLDPDFYKNLMYLHEYDGDISDLDLNFTVVDEALGVTRVTELVPNGKNTTVTNENKDLYMHLMADYKLNVQMRTACYHFRRGLEDVVLVDWLQMFDHEEFQTLVAGAEVPISIEDLKMHAVYSGGYTIDHPTIQAFWDVLPDLSNDQLSQLLRFVTSCSRPPLLGFKFCQCYCCSRCFCVGESTKYDDQDVLQLSLLKRYSNQELDPPFCIQSAGSEDRLPTASTCLNLLKLPEYTDSEILKTKLLYCLQSESGFELS